MRQPRVALVTVPFLIVAHTRRAWLLGGLCLAALAPPGAPALAQDAAALRSLHIAAQPLAQALKSLAAEADLQLLFSDEDVAGRTAGPLDGRFSPREALDRLLAGSGLTYRFTDPRTVVVAAGQRSETAPSGRAQAAAAPAAIEELIVTAQRREERLQDVPISISAFTTEMLENHNVSNVGGIGNFTPNVKIYQGTYSTSATIGIRGGVEINPAPYFDPTVGIYLDGVYVGKAQGNLFDLADIDRIEVLRGPQGTLYGRNTFAGAINVISAKPTGELGGNVKVGLGDYGQRRARVNLDLPRFGDVSLKLSGAYTRHGGYAKVLDNPFPNVAQAQPRQLDRVESADSKSARAALRWQPLDALTVDYSFDHTRTSATPRGARLVSIGHAGQGGFFDPASPAYVGALVGGTYLGFPANLYVLPDYTEGTYYTNGVERRRPKERLRINAHALTGALDLDGVTLKSITSFRRMTFGNVFDLDATPLPLANASLDNRFRQNSQEFQAIGEAGPLTYTAGLYYYHEHGRVQNLQQFFGNATTSDSRYGYSTDAYAAYTQVDYKPAFIDERLTLTGGLRYSREKKRMDAALDSRTAAGTNTLIAAGTRDTASASAWTPTAIVKYDLDRDVNVYAKYARGFKGGGFNLGTTQATALRRYAPETVDSYEIGTKARFLGGRLQFNAAAFMNKIKDYQVSVFAVNGTLTVSVVDNAAKATVRGGELEMEAQLADWLLLTSSLGYTKPKYNSYIELGVDLGNDRVFPYVSRWTASVSADATLHRAEWGEVHLQLDYQHASPYYTLAFSRRQRGPGVPNSAQNTRTGVTNLVDLSLRVSDVPVGSGTLTVSLWSKNVLNSHVRMGGVDFGPAFGYLTTGYWNPPRTIGGDITWRF